MGGINEGDWLKVSSLLFNLACVVTGLELASLSSPIIDGPGATVSRDCLCESARALGGVTAIGRCCKDGYVSGRHFTAGLGRDLLSLSGYLRRSRGAGMRALFLPEQLQKSVTKLQAMIDKRKLAKSKYESLLQDISNMMQNVTESIKKSFEQLHSFLYKEESALLQQLKAEVNLQSTQLQEKIDQIPKDLSSLDASIKAVQKEIGLQDNVDFLLNLKETQKRTKVLVPPLEHVVMKVKPENYLGPLQYWTWKNMFKILDPGLSNLTFDPDTASSHLSLCGPTRVRYNEKPKLVPDIPERFSVAAFILATDGFTSGRHYWQVDVGDGKDWSLGVARESVNRKGDVRQSPKYGYWTVYRDKDNFGAFLVHPKVIEMKDIPTRIGVYLDYEGGRVSFYDADIFSHLFTFHATFTEKVYPFFYPGLHVTKSNWGMLRLHHLYL
ncbi:nuclear factor 7, brain-like isoform X2 [Hypanus sabinus]|uniref:nuclear factor 7, brain-like isoform X2 n=1 Tax=Hypanus sabinus TaxID=79690 RepID=UPI0028C38055|nr:nuclear factor 7, brain-like isoform X2 [Hypanus sabinus]